jgi:hypothetical protein
MKILSLILSATLALSILGSCSVQKRHYRKGYHVAWMQKKSQDKPQLQPAELSENIAGNNTSLPAEKTEIASNENHALNLPLKKTNFSLLPPDTCNDQMLMKNGDMITARVTEISDEQIKYKRCDNLSGPTYSIGKEKVHSITYSNGIKEIIEPPAAYEKTKKTENIPAEKKIYPKQLKWAAFLTFTPYINYIGLPIGLFLALRAKRKILSQPQMYKGLNLANYILLFDAMVAVMIVGVVVLSTGAATGGPALFFGLALILAALIGMVAGAIYYAFK